MLRNKRGRIEWLEFEIFQEFGKIQHGIFLRHGDEYDLSVCNVGGGSPEQKEKSRVNIRKIQDIFACSKIEESFQVHGDVVKEVPIITSLEKCDGLFTDKENIALMMKHADCQATIMYDPVNDVIANLHAGWRGNVKNIYQQMVESLKARYGTKPENLIVGISPSLGPCCAEFIHYQKELPEHFWEYQVKDFHFDLWAIARMQLLQAGVLPHHIQIASLCTKCNPTDFFSYRREKKGCGNHATLILKSNGSS